LQPSWLDRALHNHALDNSPSFHAFDLLVRMMSPYQFNPSDFSPLRHLLEQSVDFERLRGAAPVKLYLSATNVRTGKIKVFGNDEITADAVLASACLPFLFQAVEVDGEFYWDGGYMGNPAIFPLIYHCESADVVVVHINPIERPDVPRRAHEIMNRVNEISFNSSLMREMRAIAFVTRLIDEGKVADGSLRRVLIHVIAADDVMQKLSVMSKLNADWEFLTHLRDDGRDHAGRWLDQHFDDLGLASTVNVEETYL
jgi:NTE family protein